MGNRNNLLLIESDLHDILERLFFIDNKYVEFWLSKPAFIREYHRLYDAGEKDGFYTFYLAAHNTLDNMRYLESNNVNIDFDFGFAHKSIEEMERRIAVGYDDRNCDPNLNFILNRISAPTISLRYWLMVPEFIDALHQMIPSEIRIDNKTVYPIMVDIYKQKELVRDESDNGKIPFNFKMARKAIKSIEKRLKIPENECM